MAELSYTISTDGFSVQFATETCDPGLEYNWDFGDGSFLAYNSAHDAPAHTYAFPGTYVVTLKCRNACGAINTYTAIIEIEDSSPQFMSLTLEGPTIVPACHQAIYNADITGGTPPYTIEWDLSEAYTEDCISAAPSHVFTGYAQEISARFLDNAGLISVKVKVTDAQSQTLEDVLLVKIRPGADLDIWTVGQPDCDNERYKAGTEILFKPLITPLNAFQYPTNYLWDFGDGQTYLDNFDGGGIVLHSFNNPSNLPKDFVVKLTVSDDFGSMQTTKVIKVCGSNGGSGGTPPGGTNGCSLEIVDNPSLSTLVLNYNKTPFYGEVKMNYPHSQYCKDNSDLRWQLEMNDCGLGEIDDISYPAPISNYEFFRAVDLLTPFWSQVSPPEKPWGCVMAKATVTHNNSTDCQCFAQNPCAFYIKPTKLDVEDFEVSGSCGDYIITANISGGGWKKVGNEFTYKSIKWSAFDPKIDWDAPGFELPADILIAGTKPNEIRVNLEHPYFDRFDDGEESRMIGIDIEIEDFAGNIISEIEYFHINDFKVTLKPVYYRCPGTETGFSDEDGYPDIIMGGSGQQSNVDAFQFTWSSPALEGMWPTFTAPAAGQEVNYSVTVSDNSTCTKTASTRVIGRPLNLSMPATVTSCSTNSTARIGPADPVNLGGSGEYEFKWTSADPAHLAYLSATDIANPVVNGIPAYQSITYTLTIKDRYADCTASANVLVSSVLNNVQVSLPEDPFVVCFRTPTELLASGNIFNPPGQPVVKGVYSWETNHYAHKIPAGFNGSPLLLDELVTSYPGNWQYTVRYTNPLTGCYATDQVNVQIRPSWQHEGFAPEVRTAIAGSEVNLWLPLSNIYKSGAGPQAPYEISWAAQAPNSFNGAASGLYQPVNGKFSPTKEMPYLSMRVQEKSTGCEETLKTITYLVVSSKPELRIEPEKRILCTGETGCFDIVFDAHLDNYFTSLLPTEITVRFTAAPPTFFNPLGQTTINQDVKLNLNSPYGHYTGRVCLNDYFIQQTPLPATVNAYQVSAQLLDEGKGKVFRLNTGSSSPSYSAGYAMFVQNPMVAPDLTACVIGPAGTVTRSNKLTLGVPPCPQIPLSMGNAEAMGNALAGDFIEILPTGIIEIGVHPDNPHGTFYGISPCIESAFMAVPSEQRSEQEQNKNTEIQNSGLGVAAMEVIPNPFTGRVTLRVTVDEQLSGEVNLDVRSYTGQIVDQISQNRTLEAGTYEFVYDAGHLPPGVYFYHLQTDKGVSLIKKAIKLTQN
ncbi:MAG: PKD domain-containing protein [Chitinophagales bacterium]|nr:PKD domain-containing protein [Chitinophagales bacterium]